MTDPDAVILDGDHPSEPDTIESQLGRERRKVDVSTLNFSVRELVRMMADGELSVAPEYQRKFRWPEANESSFIESVFLGLPIPPIFVATNVGFQWEVVDGLQRLSTLMHFLASSDDELKLINRQLNLRLSGLEKLSQLNSKVYSDVPRTMQVYFGRQPLQVVSLTDKSDLQVRFDVFERLNKGAVSLTAQEVRACVFRGEFNDFLEELATDANLVSLLKLQEARRHDGTKAEQVLKFFAYKDWRDHFDGRVEHFLNEYMDKESKHVDRRSASDVFRRSTQLLHQFCGGPYLRSDYGVTPLVQFEACIVAVAELLESGSEVMEPYPGWQDDGELKKASMGGTNTRNALRRRIDRAKDLFSGAPQPATQ